MDTSQKDELLVLSLKIAEDLTMRLLERRSISVAKVPTLISFLGKKCQDFLKSDPATGVPYLRLAASITGRLIERGSFSDQEAIAISLAENMVTLKDIGSKLPEKYCKAILGTSVNLVLKMLETKTLSISNVKSVLSTTAENASTLFGTN
jgi:hypothetical protein